MSWAERNRVPDGAGGGMLAQLTPVVKWLLFLNVGIFFGDMFFFENRIGNFGAFAIRSAVFEGKIWEFITFQFIHGSVGHVLMNSMGLFFFGPWMERWWGSVRFTLFYLVCGAGGALFFMLLVFGGILPQSISVPLADGKLAYYPMTLVPLVGASAGLYGILVGVAVIAPSLKVSLLFPPVTLTMRTLALILLVIAVGAILLKIGGNEGGEAGHLGGAIVGFILVQSAILWGKSRLPGGNDFQPMERHRRRRREDIEAKIRPRTTIDLRGQTEIDAILDKISKDGFQSITQEERDLLRRAAQSEQDRP